MDKKSGEGYYKYSDDKYERVTLSEELAEKCDPIQLVANILNNAAWLVSNGASDIEEIEKAAQLGLGLKKPLFETAKEIGIKRIVDELNKLAEEHGEFLQTRSIVNFYAIINSKIFFTASCALSAPTILTFFSVINIPINVLFL